MKYNVSPSCQITDLNNIYEKYFDETAQNIFIEVGAYDGESFSNTSCLADMGWTGYYFEPISYFANKCHERHKNNKNIKVFGNGISSKEGMNKFYFGNTLTTSNVDAVDAYKQIEWSKGLGFNQTVDVYCLRLDSFIKEYNIPKNIDLLVIDVEGNEFDVLNSFSFDILSPKLLIVELEDNHPDISKYEKLKQNNINARELIKNNGYKEVYRDIINTVFVKESV